MDVRQLQYFSTVARLGSFSRAASVLRITQPALSKQVSNLEESLKRRLFIRNGRGVTLTEAGQHLLRRAQSILELMVLAEAEVRASGAGRFAIGLPVTIGATIGNELIVRLKQAQPSADLVLIQGRSHFLMEHLFAGSLDVAIVFSPVRSPLVTVTPLVTASLQLMASARAARALARQLPIPLENICDLPLIGPTKSSANRQILEVALRRYNKTPRFMMEIDNLETVVEMIARDAGFALLSNMARNLCEHRSSIVGLPVEPPLHAEIGMVVTMRGSLSDASRQLLHLTARIAMDLLQDGVDPAADEVAV